MANSLVEFYRQNLASQGAPDDPRSDYDITQEFGQSPDAQTLFQAYPDFAQDYDQIRSANAPSIASEFTQAFKSGAEDTGATYAGAAALLTGSDKLKDVAKSWEEGAAATPPTIPSMADIDPGDSTIGKFFSKDSARYLAAKAGGIIPSLADMAGLGLAGAAVGSAVEPGLGTVAGGAEGLVEGALGRGVIKSAIKSLLEEGALGDLTTESAVTDAIKAGNSTVTDLVSQQAKARAGRAAGDVTNLVNAYALSAGGIYNETDDRALSAELGLVGAATMAPPIISLPGRVVRSLFPTLTGAAARKAAQDLVGEKTGDLLAMLGRGGGTVAAGTGGVIGMQAASIVAKNLKAGKDALDLSDDDWKSLREAAVGGALGSLPFAGIALRAPEEQSGMTNGGAP